MVSKIPIPEEEKRLIQKAKSGDKAAYQELVSSHTRRLYGYIYRMVGNHEDGEDMIQETLFAAYVDLHKFKGDSLFSTWLYRIAINTCCKALKRRQLGSFKSKVAIREEHSLQTDGITSVEVTSTQPDALTSAMQEETDQKVRLAVASLPRHLAEIITLKELEGYSYNEISLRLGIPVGTVMSRLNRARLKLARNLKKTGLDSQNLAP